GSAPAKKNHVVGLSGRRPWQDGETDIVETLTGAESPAAGKYCRPSDAAIHGDSQCALAGSGSAGSGRLFAIGQVHHRWVRALIVNRKGASRAVGGSGEGLRERNAARGSERVGRPPDASVRGRAGVSLHPDNELVGI